MNAKPIVEIILGILIHHKTITLEQANNYILKLDNHLIDMQTNDITMEIVIEALK